MNIRQAIASGEGWEDVMVRAKQADIGPRELGEIYEAAFIAGEIRHDMFIMAKKKIGAEHDITL